jgi:hypothetical protein
VKLLARESINSKQFVHVHHLHLSHFVTDQGTLRVDLLAGKDLRSADRTGKLYYVHVVLVLRRYQANPIHSPSSLLTARRCSHLKPRRKLSTLIGRKCSKLMWYASAIYRDVTSSERYISHPERRQIFLSKFSIGTNLNNPRVLGAVPSICMILSPSRRRSR